MNSAFFCDSVPPRASHYGDVADLVRAAPGVSAEASLLAPARPHWALFQAHLDDYDFLSGHTAGPIAATGGISNAIVSIMLQLSGDKPWTVNGHASRLDSVTMLGPGTEVMAKTDGPVRWMSVHVAPHRLSHLIRATTGKDVTLDAPGLRIKRLDSHCIYRLRALERMITGTESATCPLDTCEPEAFGRRLLEMLASCIGDCARPLNNSYVRVVKKAREYMEAHLDAPIYIAQLCLACGVSDRWLREAFHFVYGIGPNTFLRIHRLNRARHALLHPQRKSTSVGRIAKLYGLSDAARFSRAYRSLFGETPVETLRGA